jgi:hypothetical protein
MATLINICGASRSGTTVLDLMLGNATNAFSCGEVYAWFRPWRIHHKKLKCSCGDVRCVKWERLRNLPASAFHRDAFKSLNVDFIVDSSKDEVWVLDTHRWAAVEGFKLRNILIWKDPVELAYSWWKRGRGVDFWRGEFIAYHSHIRSSGIGFASVKHSSIVRDPQETLAAICRYCGMDYFRDKEKFWTKEHHFLFGSAGTQKQARGDLGSGESIYQYPEEFLDAVGGADVFGKNDGEVMELIRWIQQRDIHTIHDTQYSPEPRMLLRYPGWYYINRFKRLVRSIIPRKEEW